MKAPAKLTAAELDAAIAKHLHEIEVPRVRFPRRGEHRTLTNKQWLGKLTSLQALFAERSRRSGRCPHCGEEVCIEVARAIAREAEGEHA